MSAGLVLGGDTARPHYNGVIMSAMAYQITSITIVYSIVYLSADQRKHQSSALLVFVRGSHRRPVNSPHKGPVTRKMLPFDDVIMQWMSLRCRRCGSDGIRTIVINTTQDHYVNKHHIFGTVKLTVCNTTAHHTMIHIVCGNILVMHSIRISWYGTVVHRACLIYRKYQE